MLQLSGGVLGEGVVLALLFQGPDACFKLFLLMLVVSLLAVQDCESGLDVIIFVEEVVLK